MSKKSLLFVHDFPPILGGQSTYYFNLAKGFDPADLVICAPIIENSEKVDKKLPFKIIRIDFFRHIPILGKIIAIFYHTIIIHQIIKKENITYLHCGHVLSTGIVGYLLGLKYIVYTHSADILQYQRYSFFKFILKQICNKAYLVISNSQFTKQIVKNLGIPDTKVRVIYPTINVDKFKNPESGSVTKEKYRIPNDRTIILSVNRLIERKGNDTVIKSLPALLREFPNLLYIIVGDGPCHPILEGLVDKLNLANHVKFLNKVPVSELKNLYNISDIFVMLNRKLEKHGDAEGFGIVFLEAGALYKPVIGGNNGGAAEAIEHNINGLLIDSSSITEFTQAVKKILSDKTFAQLLGQNGHDRVVQKFNWTSNVEIIRELFN
ncbi:MAG: glycosyltransferase family 4 protein [Candidatus Omnitrophica bacterium]|nr:glycosyltransferase family 4 protein [Candidatus Omnitrophota bacterium]